MLHHVNIKSRQLSLAPQSQNRAQNVTASSLREIEANIELLSQQQYPLQTRPKETTLSPKPYLVQSLLPAVLSFHHQLDAVGQGRQDACCGGFESNGFTLKVDPISAFRIGR